MKLNNYLEKCKEDDVLCHQKKLFKLGEFKKAIITIFKTAIPDKLQEELAKQDLHINPMKIIYDCHHKPLRSFNNNNAWFEEGVVFQILRAGAPGWQKGKLKINVTLEFIPDEPEENKSPLDDVRQEIDKSDR